MFTKKLLLIVLSIVLAAGLTACTQLPATTAEIALSLPTAANQLQEDQFTAIVQAAKAFLQANHQSVVISAEEVFEKVVMQPDPNYYVVDLRQMEHFVKGSIVGAVNIPYSVTWQPEQIAKLPTDKKIILVCYSGHTAAQTAAFWGMLGFDVAVLENGMRGWLKNQEIIGTSPLACAPENYQISVEPAAAATTYSLPEIDEEAATLAELLIKQNEKFFASGESSIITNKIVQEEVITAETGGFFLLDIRKSEHYQAGHLPGAINIPLEMLAQADSLKKIPADKKVVLICYTGHEAAMTARILNQLGYNAVPMLNGMSAWTGDATAIGSDPINCTKVANLPTIVTLLEAGATGAG